MASESSSWFSAARYGLFIHFGLYSQLARGEWVMNREGIPPETYRCLADEFHPDRFDAGAIADLAVAGGMRYLVFTTMHHDGFRLYDSALSPFCSTRTAAGRDFTAEIIAAARERGLKIGLYHSLNNWYDQPDAVAALEDAGACETFLEATFARIRELVTRYQPIDILWYDGWWPFNAEQWRGEAMNAMVREIQPHVLFNGRNGLPGDFATPEQHLSAPKPWRPWEACVTLNESWGFNATDHEWKSPMEVIKMLVKVAQEGGNLLLNIGPRGDGSIPEESVRTIRSVGDWLRINGEAMFETDHWTLDPFRRGDHRGDWLAFGPVTTKGNRFYLIAARPAPEIVIRGLEAEVRSVRALGAEGGPLPFRCEAGRLAFAPVTLGGPGQLPTVYRVECDRPPVIYNTGGMRTPACDHPRYDPLPPDIAW